MKRVLSLFCLLAAGSVTSAQHTGNVGIGTSNPDSASILDLNSTTKALLLPRIGNARLNSMYAREGMLAYGSDTGALMIYGKAGTETLAGYTAPNQSLSPTTGVAYGQSYLATATYALQSIGLTCSAGTANGFQGVVRVYSGSGTGGALLGTANAQLVPGAAPSAMINADLSGSGIVFQAGQVYTFTLTMSTLPPGFALRFYNPAGYSGGASSLGSGLNFGFEIRGKALGWRPLYTPVSLATALSADYVTTGAAQTIAGLKTFTNGKIRMTGGGDTLASSGGLVLHVNDDNNGSDNLVVSKGRDTSARELLRISGSGNASVAGSVNAASVTTTVNGTGSANMLAAAYGNVSYTNNTLVINKSSGNFGITRLGAGMYNITFSPSSPLAGQAVALLPVTVSLVDAAPGFINWFGNTNGTGYIRIITFDQGVRLVDKQFTFVVFNP